MLHTAQLWFCLLHTAQTHQHIRLHTVSAVDCFSSLSSKFAHFRCAPPSLSPAAGCAVLLCPAWLSLLLLLLRLVFSLLLLPVCCLCASLFVFSLSFFLFVSVSSPAVCCLVRVLLLVLLSACCFGDGLDREEPVTLHTIRFRALRLSFAQQTIYSSVDHTLIMN